MWEFIVEIQFEGFILEIQYRELASLEWNKSDLMIYSFFQNIDRYSFCIVDQISSPIYKIHIFPD